MSPIVASYDAGRLPHEESRKALASRIGISYGNVKIKAYRIREKLAACARDCMEKTDDDR